jgi:hypothetical protein
MPTLTTLTLHAAVTGTHGWSAGHAFKKADLPAGQTLSGLQLNIKNYWPDGSAKFGIVSGQSAITAGTPTTVTLATGAAATGSTLSIADLKATGVTASISCGAFGSASWAGTDWDTPLEAWFTGPLASFWRFRKAVGSDPHLSAWLEVTLYAGGAVEVLPWVENSTITTAGITNKSDTYGFTLGGASRFSAAINLPNRCRTPLLSGASLTYFLGTDPGVMARHNAAYLAETKLVPTYLPTVPDGHGSITGIVESFTPLEQGGYPVGMGSAGYHNSIGVIPGWDALYVCNAASTKPLGQIIRQAYRAGRYGFHMRNESTNAPVLFADFPTHNLGANSGIGDSGASSTGLYFAAGSGTAPATWKVSHHPAVGYVAYLATGRKYHLETLQFSATGNHYRVPQHIRQGATGLQLTTENSTRSAAWALRTLALTASATPDADTAHKAQFVATLGNNVDRYHTQYVAQSNNPWGFTAELEVNGAPNNDAYTPAVAPYHQSAFMHHHFGAGLGIWKTLEITLGGGNDAKFDAFYTWKCQSLMLCFGGAGANDYLYRDAGVGVIAAAPLDSSNWVNGTGPWFANPGEVWAGTHGGQLAAYSIPAQTKEIGDGTLRGGNYPDATSYWGNMLQDLAYAVTNGISGAQTAWNLITAAPNWSSFAASAVGAPVYALAPAAASAPTPPPQGTTVRVDGASLISGVVVVGVAGHGVLGALVPTTGDDGGSLIDSYLTRPHDDNVEGRVLVTAVSSGVTIQADETGAATITVPGDGSHWIDYQIFKAGALFATDRLDINVGTSTGAINVTESGPDTAALAGYKSAFGAVAATESGPDTAQLVGGMVNTGAIDATESGPDTAVLLATGAPVVGQINATESGSDIALLIGQFPYSTSASVRRVRVSAVATRVAVPIN